MFAKQIPSSVFVAVTMPDVPLASKVHKTRAIVTVYLERGLQTWIITRKTNNYAVFLDWFYYATRNFE